MSGENVSYNLRPNKFVERQLFVDLLAKICRESPERYVYISLGGPQLEDHKLVHHVLGFKNLISLEEDGIVHKRQEFNLRPSCVQCQLTTTSDFVTDFDTYAAQYSDKNFIIWFDYASPKERRQQLAEYQALLRKMQPGDILKITMNANPQTLADSSAGENQEKILAERLEQLRKQLDDYMPSGVESSEMTNRGLVPILCQAIKKASLNATEHSPRLEVVPMAIFTYRDGPHQMLTITVSLTQKADSDGLIQRTKSYGWEFIPEEWDDVTRINVPNLTAKERLFIESQLFLKETNIVHNELPFRFDKDDDESLRILEEYARHYRRYPSYFQVIL